MYAKPRVFVRFSRRRHEVLALLDTREFQVVPITRQSLRSLLQRPQGCLVLADGVNFDGLVGLLASICSGCPFVVRLRGNFFTEQKEIAATEQRPARHLRLLKLRVSLGILRQASAIVFNSCYLRDSLAALVPRTPQYVVESPVVVSDEMLASAEGHLSKSTFDNEYIRLRVLTLTNMEAYGKVMGLVKAIRWLGKKPLPEQLRGRIFWSIYGKGRFYYLLEQAVASAGLQSMVQLKGYTRQPAEELRRCDVLAHFTELDAFPNATLEAMYFNKPIITNDNSCGTLEQVEHGCNGFVVRGRGDLIAALLKYSNNPDLRALHGNRGRKLLEQRYTSLVLARPMSDVLMDVLRRPTHATLGEANL